MFIAIPEPLTGDDNLQINSVNKMGKCYSKIIVDEQEHVITITVIIHVKFQVKQMYPIKPVELPLRPMSQRHFR